MDIHVVYLDENGLKHVDTVTVASHRLALKYVKHVSRVGFTSDDHGILKHYPAHRILVMNIVDAVELPKDSSGGMKNSNATQRASDNGIMARSRPDPHNFGIV